MIGFTGQTYIVPTSARKNILFPGFLLVTAFYQKLHEKKNIVNSSKAGEKISMFRCHQAVTRAAFSGVTLIMRLRLPTVGWVVQQSAKNLPSAPYRVICDIWMKMTFIWFFYRYFFVVDRSAVTGRFSLFLWVRDGVVQLPSWRASSRPEIALECKILSFSRTSRARMRFWKT